VASAIRSAAEFSAARLPAKIRDSVAELHRLERRLLGEDERQPEATAEEVPA
jgi:hypothetical protein